jgi:hypothetical protein
MAIGRININNAEKDITKLVKSAILSIQKIDNIILTTGDDSVLKNYWDEICVQQQCERFYSWSLYDTMIDLAIESAIENLPRKGRVIISKLAEYKLNGKIENDNFYSPEIMVDFIKRRVLEAANDYTNARIRKYLDNSILD